MRGRFALILIQGKELKKIFRKPARIFLATTTICSVLSALPHYMVWLLGGNHQVSTRYSRDVGHPQKVIHIAFTTQHYAQTPFLSSGGYTPPRRRSNSA